MSGYRPQNSGNKSHGRAGTAVARRLRSAGWNVSPARNRNVREGIYVKAMGAFISVLVDLPGHREVAQEIGALITTWGVVPSVSQENGYSKVTFTYGARQ